jgi:hypothetical protein
MKGKKALWGIASLIILVVIVISVFVLLNRGETSNSLSEVSRRNTEVFSLEQFCFQVAYLSEWDAIPVEDGTGLTVAVSFATGEEQPASPEAQVQVLQDSSFEDYKARRLTDLFLLISQTETKLDGKNAHQLRIRNTTRGEEVDEIAIEQYGNTYVIRGDHQTDLFNLLKNSFKLTC